MEKWKDIKGYEGLYQISSNGRVRSLVDNHHKKYVAPKIRQISVNKGYCFIALIKDGKRKNKLIHRLVAEAFIPNTYCKNEVNHKDGDKSNNTSSNLEWCTRSENITHMYRKLGYETNNYLKRKKTLCVETGVVYESLMEAARQTGIDFSLIGRACRGVVSQTNGYHWEYI